MICPKCGTKIVGRRRRCEKCGTDISALDILRKTSNRLYNEGLEMASVRNLTGAVDKLRKSLEMNKENIQARNLLGLVYYELGECTMAVCEWVISTNLKKEDNDAERLLKLVRADANEYQNFNTAIRKFNIALDLAQNGNDDMAMIQLKRVVGLNPHYVKAHLLMALIYIKNNEYERAKKILKHILKVDVGNVTARRYINEIKVTNVPGNDSQSQQSEEYDFTGTGASKSRIYTEDKPNFLAVITFFIGLAIGIAVVYILAVPNIKSDIRRDYEERERQIGIEVSKTNADISSYESKIRILENENTDLKSRILLAEREKTVDYSPLLKLYTDYLDLYDRIIKPAEGGEVMDENGLREINVFNEKLLGFDMTDFTDDSSMKIYAAMAETIGLYTTDSGDEPEDDPNTDAGVTPAP